ncbi:hypothetical protein CSC74_12955 [Pseudoxanthomonas yeongjuensis]|uniref:AbiU2 domain-containing protein n=1 Tax=Pseudoxanthomonas yeongjuensis TaxID=377616 RepID=UPI001390993B|nr:hypothetical protein [Pseudoxanthomonas yeongjuensis]KAF1715479.1 hypothetical protein CSC74_12955 [Pseudoxanthomonas yeongjuensis]
MTTTRTEAEVKDDYISSMGEDLGTAFFQLYRKLMELHIVWQQYRQLFGKDSDTVHLLNRMAGLFFKIIQDEIWDSVLLGISRMTDPPKTGNKKNLTIQSLPSLISDPTLKAEVETLCAEAVAAAEFAREHRNKRIAHQDHDYLTDRASNPLSGVSRERVETMLASLRKVLNRLDLHYRDTTVMYEDFVDESGARLLVAKLKKLELLASPVSAL